MIVKKGDVITLASGILESYNREGPFIAVHGFDLDAFVSERTHGGMKRLEVDDLLEGIPAMLIELGLLTELPCRRIYLGAMGEIDIKAEKCGP